MRILNVFENNLTQSDDSNGQIYGAKNFRCFRKIVKSDN